MRLIELADRMGDTDLCAIRSAKLIAVGVERGFDVSTLKDNELGRAANCSLVRYERAFNRGADPRAGQCPARPRRRPSGSSV